MKPRQITALVEDLAFAAGKMAFVAGPRQVGKTTLGKAMLAARTTGRYCTWDDVEFRRAWVKDPKRLVPAGSGRPLLVLDEIHKGRLWKRSLKGVYDTLETPADILVTGSARLDVYRRGSDSLMGRYLHFRLHPFTLRELRAAAPLAPDAALESLAARADRPRRAAAENLTSLLRYGGFPEPLLAQDERRANLWRRGRLEKVIREDLRDLTRLPELDRVELLAALIPERVASTFSVQSIREDLEVAHDTASRWLAHLRELFYVYEVKPYHRAVQRALRKSGKLYLWDWSEVAEPGPRFENAVASHLLKACHFWSDSGEGTFDLHYLRDKEHREIDFLVTRGRRPWLAVEAKSSDATPSPAWRVFVPQTQPALAVQVVATEGHWRWHEIGQTRVLVASASEVLGYLP
ncbi:MAG: ATP-binding protein [Deltaproteobacteria bacterium]|nr:ATP-binding protein [Deltaproteobacteria bacterium]